MSCIIDIVLIYSKGKIVINTNLMILNMLISKNVTMFFYNNKKDKILLVMKAIYIKMYLNGFM